MLNDPRQFEIRTRTQDCFVDKKKTSINGK